MASSERLFDSGEWTPAKRSCEESGVFVVDPTACHEKREPQVPEPLRALRSLSAERLTRILRIREEIAQGTYETEEKWRTVLDCMMYDLRRRNAR
jgi:hypothetical protein